MCHNNNSQSSIINLPDMDLEMSFNAQSYYQNDAPWPFSHMPPVTPPEQLTALTFDENGDIDMDYLHLCHISPPLIPIMSLRLTQLIYYALLPQTMPMWLISSIAMHHYPLHHLQPSLMIHTRIAFSCPLFPHSIHFLTYKVIIRFPEYKPCHLLHPLHLLRWLHSMRRSFLQVSPLPPHHHCYEMALLWFLFICGLIFFSSSDLWSYWILSYLEALFYFWRTLSILSVFGLVDIIIRFKGGSTVPQCTVMHVLAMC